MAENNDPSAVTVHSQRPLSVPVQPRRLGTCMTPTAMSLLMLLGFFIANLTTTAQAKTPSSAAEMLIEQAGNTEDEREREAALKELSALPGDEALSMEAHELAAFVERWNGKSLHFYNQYRKRKVPGGVPEYDFNLRTNSPLNPIAELYRGRILAWELIENSKVRTNPEPRALHKNEAIRSFEAVEAAFPKNRIPGAYLGRPIPWPKQYEAVDGAPEWARLQREHIDRFRDIIHWWIDNRQERNGALGGGVSDDCEMWRWWAPILVSFDDPKINAAQALISTNLMAGSNMKAGYGNIVSDVEHSAEDSTDSIVPLMLLQPEDSKWEELARKLPPLMKEVWTGKNQQGQLQFRGYWFSATEVSPDPAHALDVIGNVVAVNPIFLLWLKTRDPELGQPLTAWLDTWVEATAREENGKPAGILPASISWPDGKVAGSQGRWWAPVPQGEAMAMYYIWPSVLTEMTDAMLVAHIVTGDDKYLAPIRSMAAIRLKYLKNPPAIPPEPGSEDWCAAQLAPPESSHNNYGALVKSLARCRALTGTREFDELISLEGAQFAVGSGAADHKGVEEALRNSLKFLGVNFPLFTSEVRWTDRIPGRYVHFLAGSPTTAYEDYVDVTLPKYEMLYRMVSGDGNYVRFPMPAVRWRTQPEEIAAWVRDSSRSHLEAELFHFGTHPRPMRAELWLLSPGNYRVELFDKSGRAVGGRLPSLEVKQGSLPTVAFQLPAQELCELRITSEANVSTVGR